jgi:hypothetical protein
MTTTTEPSPPDERWVAVFHKVNGWMEAPPGAYFRANGETVELVGGIHRCGSAWYATSITKRRELGGSGG